MGVIPRSRSHGVIPRSEKLWMIPISPCDPNVMLFHPLVSKIWDRAGQNDTFFDNNCPPSWMCHWDWTGCWTWYTPNQKEAILSISMQFCHMPEKYKRVLVGYHCAQVKGHVELKIEKNVKTFSYDSPKLHHYNPNSFGVNVHLHHFFI